MFFSRKPASTAPKFRIQARADGKHRIVFRLKSGDMVYNIKAARAFNGVLFPSVEECEQAIAKFEQRLKDEEFCTVKEVF